jgi:hypothetical protein
MSALGVGEDARIGVEDRRGARILDVGVELDRVGARDADELEHQAEKVLEVLRLPVRPLEDLGDVLQRVRDAVLVVGDHEGAERGAGDHHHLVGQRVQDDADLAAGDHVAAEDHHEHDADADDSDHESIPLALGARASLAVSHPTRSSGEEIKKASNPGLFGRDRGVAAGDR